MTEPLKGSNQKQNSNPSRISSAFRPLTAEEKAELRRDMEESSAWAKVELKRRRVAKI